MEVKAENVQFILQQISNKKRIERGNTKKRGYKYKYKIQIQNTNTNKRAYNIDLKKPGNG